MPTTNLGLTTIMQSDPVSPDPINENVERSRGSATWYCLDLAEGADVACLIYAIGRVS